MNTTQEHAFFVALTSRDVDSARVLLRRHPELSRAIVPMAWTGSGNERDELARRRSAFQLALEYCGDEFALEMLDKGVNMEHRDRCHRGAIHDAFEFGATKTLQTMIRKGVRLDVAVASGLGALDVLDRLLQGDPTRAHERTTGLEPMGWAAYGDQPNVIRRLHALGATARTKHLAMAASCGNVQAVKTLLDLGADPNGDSGYPLHEAAAMRYSTCTEAVAVSLLAAGADLERRDPKGRRPRDVAEERLDASTGDPLRREALASLLEGPLSLAP